MYVHGKRMLHMKFSLLLETYEIPRWKVWGTMCIARAEGENERHEDITKDLSLMVKKGSISVMKIFLPRWRQYFLKPFVLLEYLEAPWVLQTVHSHQVKKKRWKKVCCTVYSLSLHGVRNFWHFCLQFRWCWKFKTFVVNICTWQVPVRQKR